MFVVDRWVLVLSVDFLGHDSLSRGERLKVGIDGQLEARRESMCVRV